VILIEPSLKRFSILILSFCIYKRSNFSQQINVI